VPRPRNQSSGIIDRALGKLEEISGYSLIPSGERQVMEATTQDYRMLRRELDIVGYSVLDYLSQQPQELSVPARRQIVQRTRYVWMNDPLVGAASDLTNDFVFGRGVPAPRAKDKAVQEVIDEAWEDVDNNEVLTGFDAQLALGTSLYIQSNLFFLLFDDGQDGKVKLSLLNHDSVVGAVPDNERAHRILWYMAEERKSRWDYKADRWEIKTTAVPKVLYYPHWRNVALSEEEGEIGPTERPPSDKIGTGKVYHVRINRYSEQIFGVPASQRILRWVAGYNEFLKARLDMAMAAASLIMERKITGSPGQVARDVTKLLNRQSPLGVSSGDVDPATYQIGPRSGSIAVGNEAVQHLPLRLDSGAGNAAQDAQQIRAPFSASERWPAHYLGDQSDTTLAGATSLELPVLKKIEKLQEVFEQLFRWFIDRVIERAVESGRISEYLTPEEIAEREREERERESQGLPMPTPAPAPAPAPAPTTQAVAEQDDADMGDTGFAIGDVPPNVAQTSPYSTPLVDEEKSKRNLDYEFGMPSPLRRMMSDLIQGIVAVAQTFDPNGTNTELSRVLLTIVMGEALEVQDPADVVDRVFPPGYLDPALRAAAMQAQQQGDQQMPSGPEGNTYGAPMNPRKPEQLRSAPYQAQEAAANGSDGLDEHFDHGLDEPARRRAQGEQEELERLWQESVITATLRALEQEEHEARQRG
jgi:hypothetical protein